MQKNCQVYSINNLFLENGFLNSAIEYDAERTCLRPFPSIRSVFPLCFLWPRYSKCMPSSAALFSLLYLCTCQDGCANKKMDSSSQKSRKRKDISTKHIILNKKRVFECNPFLGQQLVLSFPLWWKTVLVAAVESLIYSKSNHRWQRGFYPQISSEV